MNEINIDANIGYDEYLKRIPKDLKIALDKHVSNALYGHNYSMRNKDFVVAYHLLHSYIFRHNYAREKDLQKLICKLDSEQEIRVRVYHELIDEYFTLYLSIYYKKDAHQFKQMWDWFKQQGINSNNIEDYVVKTEYISF